MKVLVCDDAKARSDEIVGEISAAGQEGVEVTRLIERDLDQELGRLFKTVEATLNGEAAEDTAFDSFDLILIDNNLAELPIKGARLTAESIAGYIRAFSAAPYIVSLNKNSDIDFDLRFLIGDFSTKADLTLNGNHLANPALWTGKLDEATNGFRPWYWPNLLSMPDRRRAQIDFVKTRLKDAIFETLNIPANETRGFLSLHAAGALSPDAEVNGESADGGIPIGDVTFLDFFQARDRSLPIRKERSNLLEKAKNGNEIASEVIARVVAADIDYWFRRDVLGPQDALVDIPHLLMRMPLLLGRGAIDAARWNASVTARVPPFELDEALFKKHLAGAMFKHDIWVPSPSFWWPTLKANQELNELFLDSKQEDWLDVVFCEDRSMFLERVSVTGPLPIEFEAEFEGAWSRRYVTRIDGIRYVPRSRFAVV